MVQDAESHAEDDKKRREGVEARNGADSMLHATEKNLSEYGDKVPAEDKAAIEEAAQQLKDALEGDDIEDITAKTEALAQASMKLGEAMYKAAQAEGEGGDGQAADAGGKPAGDNVVDADFEEVDPDAEKKKDA